MTFKGQSKVLASFLILLFAAGLLFGALASFYITYKQVNSLSTQVTNLESQVSDSKASKTPLTKILLFFKTARH